MNTVYYLFFILYAYKRIDIWWWGALYGDETLRNRLVTTRVLVDAYHSVDYLWKIDPDLTFLFDVSLCGLACLFVLKKMSSDESDSPTTLVPPELLRIKNNQSPSLIVKQENGTPTIQIVSSSSSDASNLSTGGTVLMPIVSKTSGLPLGSAVKVRRGCLVVVKLQRPVVCVLCLYRQPPCNCCVPSRRQHQAKLTANTWLTCNRRPPGR